MVIDTGNGDAQAAEDDIQEFREDVVLTDDVTVGHSKNPPQR